MGSVAYACGSFDIYLRESLVAVLACLGVGWWCELVARPFCSFMRHFLLGAKTVCAGMSWRGYGGLVLS